MVKQLLVLFIALVVTSNLAWAQRGARSPDSDSSVSLSEIGLSTNNYLDFYGFWGVTSTQLEFGDKNPTLLQYGVGLNWAFLFSGFITGIGTEYRMIEHSSDATAAEGSFNGERWLPVYLLIGYVSAPWSIKLDYQFIGDYMLENFTAQGGRVIYRNPGGWRLRIAYNLFSSLFVGLSYETVRYRHRLDTLAGQSDLREGLSLTNIGLTTAYAF